MKTSLASKLIPFLLGGTALLLSACGGSSGTSAILAAESLGPICGVGQMSLNGSPCVAGTFQSACYFAGGSLTIDGTLCRFDSILSPSVKFTNSPMPIVTPSNPAGFSTYVFGNVLPGDRVSFQGSGSWSDGVKTFLGVIPTGCKSALANQDGLDSNSNPVINEGQPAGVMISDGTEAFLVGGSGTATFSTAGTLRIGFNAPTSSGVCSTLSINVLTLTRCVNAANQTYPCP